MGKAGKGGEMGEKRVGDGGAAEEEVSNGEDEGSSSSSSSSMRAVESIPLPVDALSDIFITRVACAPEGTAVIAEPNKVYVNGLYT